MEFLLAVLAASLALAAANYAAPILLKEIGIRRLRRLCRARRAVVLSFDDGPSEFTPRVLEVLARYRVKATFFLPSSAARRRPDLVAELFRQGQEIGAHSRSHLHAWRVSPWRAHGDAIGGWRESQELGLAPALYRPAHGKITATVWTALARVRAHVCWWTIDSSDTRRQPDLGRAERLLREDGGGVVLMHDSTRGAAHADFVLRTTQALLELAASERLEVLTMGELLEGSRPVSENRQATGSLLEGAMTQAP